MHYPPLEASVRVRAALFPNSFLSESHTSIWDRKSLREELQQRFFLKHATVFLSHTQNPNIFGTGKRTIQMKEQVIRKRSSWMGFRHKC